MSWFIRSVSVLPALSSGITVRCFSFNFFKSSKKLAEKDAREMLKVLVDPLSKEELVYKKESHSYFQETLGVEYNIKDGIYIMDPIEATLHCDTK